MKDVDVRVPDSPQAQKKNLLRVSHTLVIPIAQNVLHSARVRPYMQYASFSQRFGLTPYAGENNFLETIFPAIFDLL
jgi:hypothetical protein